MQVFFSLLGTFAPVVVDPCDPSPCGPHSTCRVNDGVAACSCLPNYIGRPPQCRPECVISSECSSTKEACINQRCRDPCPGLCGFNAECRVNNHNPMCVCPTGYIGDPFTQCNIIPASKLKTLVVSYFYWKLTKLFDRCI